MQTTKTTLIGLGAMLLSMNLAQAQTSPSYTWRSGGDFAFLSHYCCAATSPDGTILVTASQDNTLKVWDVASGRLVRTLVGSGNSLQCVTFSPDGKMIAVGGATALTNYGAFQAEADVWSAGDFHHIQTVTSTDWNSTAIAFSPDSKAFALATAQFSSSDHVDHATIETFRVSDGVSLHKFIPAISDVCEMTYMKDGKTLIAAGNNNTIIPHGTQVTPTAEMWDPTTATLKNSIKTKLDYLQALRLSPDGTTIALGGSGKQTPTSTSKAQIELWDITGKTLKSSLYGASNAVRSFAYTPDGATILSGGLFPAPNQAFYGAMENWKAATGQRILSKKLTDRSAVTTIVPLNNGASAIFESELGEVDQISTTTAAVSVHYTQRGNSVYGVVNSGDGNAIAYTDGDAKLQIANAVTGAVTQTIPIPVGQYVDSYVFTKDCTQLVCAQSNGLFVYNMNGSPAKQISTVEYSTILLAAGKNVLVTTRGYDDPQTGNHVQVVEQWEPGTFRKLGQINTTVKYYYEMAVSPDGTRVAFCGHTQVVTPQQSFDHGFVQIYRLSDGKLLGASDISAPAPNQILAATGVSFSPDSKTLAVSYATDNRNDDSAFGAIRLFNAATCKVTVTIATTDYINFIRYSADGTKLITGGYNRVANTGSASGSLTVRRTSDNAIVVNYTADLGTSVDTFSLNEALDQILVTTTDDTISAFTYGGI